VCEVIPPVFACGLTAPITKNKTLGSGVSTPVSSQSREPICYRKGELRHIELSNFVEESSGAYIAREPRS
jgi:hypothetical protein